MSDKELMQNMIARRAAKELTGPCIVNLGIGIPTLVAKYIDDENVFFHTENGLLGVADVEEDEIDPNLVNAGKLPVGESIGASFFNSAESFAMIRGGHIDVAILGVLQVGQTGEIANWAVPGKNIMGVGGAMDLLVGAKKVIVTMTHTSKEGKSKVLNECTYPITSTRSVDLIITELAVFEVIEKQLKLIELMPGITIEEVRAKTEADFIY
ncbi:MULTISPECIES: 3-oxoacid CoA-transferase subunit B [Bacillaceae]|uniref:3-oxoacid CoA-transferase subunit B n=1 Tax=Bacillaceae TaxID=186817 RepID=UPI000C32FDA7|nr:MULTISPECIES: 3-oxoacid CoA-transferase subunit B [Bacillaceae]MCT4477207.1 3-oxoacid CoA-transferase subunit B [Peribacillus frigoritolerans]PKF90220.1 succinyl-CoA--3-ketoacid-CoA transferase [Bacillus sp. BA3]CAH0185822.1 Succinyl-CoA:3-ketoacid coenzyme A transferase subunit B [Peribacillus sp. Bi134]